MSLRRSTRILSRGAVENSTLTVPRNAITTATASAAKSKKRSASAQESSLTESKNKRRKPPPAERSPFKKPDPQSTPAKKTSKQTKSPKVPPPTLTPSLVNVIRAPYSTGDIDDATPPPPPSLNRPTDPHLTNATLVTPRGTKVTASSQSSQDPSSPLYTGDPTKPPSTTGLLLAQACAHLIKVDPRIANLVASHHCAIFSPDGLAEKIDPFRSLTSGICGQQVSGAAAKAIKNKFVALFNDEDATEHVWPTPKRVAETSVERLRTAGLSQRKAEYIQGLAEKFVSGELSTRMLLDCSDEEVMEKLIAVRGLGKWSVEMFMCFGLKRMDILSTGDLGVQRGMAAYFGKDIAKLKAKGGGKWKYMSEQDMLAKSAVYAPYRSLFMWYMWRVEDVDTVVLEG